jgi:superfamily I DNA and/or RNA helicase
LLDVIILLNIQNWKRINVAMTRAKKKLLLVGNIEVLSEIGNIKKLISYFQMNNKVMEIS